MRGFVGLVSGGNAMQGSWVSLNRVVSAWTIKYTLRVSFEISCKQSIYMVVISAKDSFISLLLHFN